MPNTQEETFKDINFSLFAKEMTSGLKNALEQFWGKDCFVYLQAVNEFKEIRNEAVIKGIDFFSSKINVDSHKPVTIRLSKNFVETYLNTAFMESSEKFNLTSLTPLEIKILNNFSEYFYKKLNEFLIKPKDAKISEKSEKPVNVIFLTSMPNKKPAYVTISIPSDRLKLEKLNKANVFDDEYFKNSAVAVNLHIGSSKITLEELQTLSPEDIIVFEDSNPAKMTLVSGDLKQNFKIKINSSLIMEHDNIENEEEITNEVKMEKNLWDDIQIEINAEFEKVKMTIGELKQITQGQIIDLGSIYKNEVSLFVEDKKVAKGELVIINDKYAVRLNEVLSNTGSSQPQTQKEVKPASSPQQPAPKPQPKPAPRPAQPAPKPQPKPQPKPAPKKPESEDFDYSDFEK